MVGLFYIKKMSVYIQHGFPELVMVAEVRSRPSTWKYINSDLSSSLLKI